MATVIRGGGGRLVGDFSDVTVGRLIGTINFGIASNVGGSGSVDVPADVYNVMILLTQGGSKRDKYTITATNSQLITKVGTTDDGSGFYVHNGLNGNGYQQSVHQIYTTTHGGVGVIGDLWYVSLNGEGSTITIRTTENGGFYRVRAKIINVDAD